jgi:hypothetical protein
MRRGLVLIALLLPLVARADAEKPRLLGKHKLSLQWISWKDLGDAVVTEDADGIHLKGEQRGGDDFVTVDGLVTDIANGSFTFEGQIVTRVSYINQGQPCVRSGRMTFSIKGKRRYWRLREMDNPCDTATDYVDLYLRK